LIENFYKEGKIMMTTSQIDRSQQTYMRQVLQEIRATPQEYLPSLLHIIRVYRQSVSLQPAEESFRQGWRETLTGDTLPIDDLWSDINGTDLN
jgi:hypothetical protein